jgi:hypothetical protein
MTISAAENHYTGTHRYSAPPVVEVCGRDGCTALTSSDRSHRGDVHGDVREPRHGWNVRRRQVTR